MPTVTDDQRAVFGSSVFTDDNQTQLERKLADAERKLAEIISVCNEEPIYTVAGHMEVLERILAIVKGEK